MTTVPAPQFRTDLTAFKINPGGQEEVRVGELGERGMRIMAVWLKPLEQLPTDMGIVEFRLLGAARIVCTMDVEFGMLFSRRFFNGGGLDAASLDAAFARTDDMIREYQQKLATLRAHAVALDALADGNTAALEEMLPQLPDADLKEWTTTFLARVARLQYASPLLHPIEIQPHDLCSVRWWPSANTGLDWREVPPLSVAVLTETPLW